MKRRCQPDHLSSMIYIPVDMLVTFAKITESNGQTRMFTVPFAAVAQLIRPGFSRWQMSVGKYHYANKAIMI